MAVVLLALAGTAPAESLHDRIQQANGLLRSGEADKALDSYHELQVDHPESPVLEYNVGCAEYEKGVKALQSDERKPDSAALSQAIESFNRAMQNGDPVVSESAAFNRANCLAQTAKHSEASGADRVAAFQNALQAYNEVLKTDPSNASAKQNIDHLRYMLKKASPPPPPQQGGDDSKPQEDQSGEDQNQQQPQNDPSNQQNQQNPGDQPQQQKDQQENEDDASKPDDPQDQQDQAEKSENQQTDSEPSERNPEDELEDEGAPTPDRQSVEALLQSLENQDKEMQKDLRKGARATRVRPSGWW